MNKNIARKISSDLNLYKYNSESKKEYGNRLIYTALAAWARTLVLGESYTDLENETKYENADYHNVDIMHIQIRLTQISYGLLMSIPNSKKWFDNNKIEDQSRILASSIIEDLIFCYELSRLNDIRRLTNSPIRYANFKDNQLILGGEQWKMPNKKLISVGLGRWIQIPNLNKSKLPYGISLLKSVEIDAGYILVKKENNRLYTARLDKWYYDENEIYRISYALDRHNETPAIFEVEFFDDYVILHSHSKLPNSEMRILLMSSWPKRFYNDIFYRIIPRFLWDDVEDILINLGIKIKYING